MRIFHASLAVFFSLASAPALSCELERTQSIESVVAKSKNVFIVRAISTAVVDKGSGSPIMQNAGAKVRVVKVLAGKSSLSHITYDISWCGGITLAAGHYYLIATDEIGNKLYLASDSPHGIIDISRSYGLYSTRNPLNFELLQKAIELRPKKLEDGSLKRLGQNPTEP